MRNISKKSLALVSAATVGAGLLAMPAMANHSWSNYHWERTSNEITVSVVDFTTGEWAQSNRARTAVTDWNASDYIQSPYSRGSGINTACPIVAGEIHVCNDDYGDVGWLGIASISATRGRETHIIGGVTKLNDFYYAMPQYNTDVWRQLVMCQEIGHDYGLGHQNEDFSTNTTDSCMEYTSTPTAIDKTPDQHDFDQLANIYAHSHGGSDGGDTGGNPGKGGGKGKKLGNSGNTPAAWGQAIAFDQQGRPNVFKRSMSSYDIITHVTWTPDADMGDHHHEETGPRQHSGDRRF
ncbi:hypothetical protein SAMN06297468_2075 [Altererythrobacter xiamenensis]|uniref:Matrixin n=2 Tax=Altererythrobacter xiamenensis TaxID=1316679 RepID=A0A1Y6FBT0_9SPHN|nr:hypothetical protein SAMN06297468_2075 [Altererythrobacter xiamenensis]